MRPFLHVILLILSLLLSAAGTPAQLTSNPAGKLDRSFGESGWAVMGPFNSTFGDSALLSDGSTVSVGSVQMNGKFSIRVSKQRPDGTPDPDFGQYGFRIHSFPQDAFGASLVVQKDGKIVVVGSKVQNQSFIVRDYLVLRLLPSGDLDAGFGVGGVRTFDHRPGGSTQTINDRGSSVLLRPDGRLVVAGMVDYYNEGDTRTQAFVSLIGLLSNGSDDVSFGIGGMSLVQAGSNEVGDSDIRPVLAHLQSDGKIVAGINVRKESTVSPGSYAFRAIVQRFGQNGSPDNSFSDDSVIDLSLGMTPNYPSYVVNSLELRSGKLLVLTSDGLWQLNRDGTVDAAFGENGRSLIAGTPCFLAHATELRDGSLLVLKNCIRNLIPSGSRYFAQVEKYWTDGSSDIRFGYRGRSTLEAENDSIFFGRIHTVSDSLAVVTGTKGMPGMSLPVSSRLFTTRKQ